MNHFAFLKTVLRDYRRVGALSISSKYVVERIAREIGGAKLVVEYGAGDGVITKGILARMKQEGKLVAVEINPTLLEELRRIEDPRLEIREEDAISFSERFWRDNALQADAVVSGIPFSFLNPTMREKLVAHTARMLGPRGKFIVYQYSFLALSLLKRHFRKVKLRFEPRNVLPYFIMVGEK